MRNKIKVYSIHLILFIITLITTTLAGAEWTYGRLVFDDKEAIDWLTQEKFLQGFAFSLPFLGFLTVHEFGHYLTARWHKVKVSLPFYIPMWLGFSFSIGTMGAFIKIKEDLQSRKLFFDIGIAGPLAGFIVALGVLIYGFTHLPPPEYLQAILAQQPQMPQGQNTEYLVVGSNLLFTLLEVTLADPNLVPSHYNMIHYPLLMAGFFGLFFTALNLLPIGQLDGGHVLYALIGYKNHQRAALVFFLGFVFYAGLGFFSPHQPLSWLAWSPAYLLFLYIVFSKATHGFRNILLLAMSVFTAQFLFAFFFPEVKGYLGWLVFSFLLGRVLGIYHPPALEDRPLNLPRRVLGWFTLLIFVLCFSPQPLQVERKPEGAKPTPLEKKIQQNQLLKKP
ncbi:site-2 protease family protein [Microscilla marina]|uniref:Peptidase M50 n=1 Tax=Microscilla marina ATCC 23134 TaxID=313606 RepID=A1ZV38_MICM2|nr:site-2 protease family protein [Microscilla marina]EAY25694.1 peptidase M50 [Microscilla marina ATCC 23134]